MNIVSNATPLIALAKIGHLELLRAMFGIIVIPKAVHSEVVLRASGRPGGVELRQADWIRIQDVTDHTKVDYLRADLDQGEAEAVVLAEELSADWVLLDERKARLAAELVGLRFVGTMGIFLLAKRLGKIEAVRPLLDELKTKKFYLGETVYQEVLARAGE